MHLVQIFFRIAQSDDSKQDVLMHDNSSCMLLQKNRTFIVKSSKHIHVRCFFDANKTKKKEAEIMHFPTEKIISDNSSKQAYATLFAHQMSYAQDIKEEGFQCANKS